MSDGLQPHSRLRLCPHAGFAVELRVKTAQVWGKADSACAQHAPGPVGRNHGHEPTRGLRRKKIASNGQRSESHKTDGHADRRRHEPQSPGGCARIRLGEDVCDSDTPSQRQKQRCAKNVSPKGSAKKENKVEWQGKRMRVRTARRAQRSGLGRCGNQRSRSCGCTRRETSQG